MPSDADAIDADAIAVIGGGFGRGLDGQFQRVEHAAGVAVGHVHQVRQRIVVELDVELAVAALGIGQRLASDREEVVLRERLELEDAAAADQRLVDLEIGVLGGRADQDDRAVLDPRQQRVLLGLVEAVDFVDEEDGALGKLAAAFLRGGDGRADVRDARQHGVDGDEVAARGVGDDARQRGLAGAGRPVEDDGAELVGLDRAAQQPARPDDVLLADELVERARAHPGGEGRFFLSQLGATGVEKAVRLVHGLIVARVRANWKLEAGAERRSEFGNLWEPGGTAL